jgi:hypothetical protein
MERVMGIYDDVFEVKAFIEESRSKNKEAALKSFDAIEEQLWHWEAENEKLIKMIIAVADGETAMEQIKKYRQGLL